MTYTETISPPPYGAIMAEYWLKDNCIDVRRYYPTHFTLMSVKKDAIISAGTAVNHYTDTSMPDYPIAITVGLWVACTDDVIPTSIIELKAHVSDDDLNDALRQLSGWINECYFKLTKILGWRN